MVIGGDFAVMLGKDIKVQSSVNDLLSAPDCKADVSAESALPFNLDVLSKI